MPAPSHDVVVVGAGIVGCMCAYFLARRGLRVLVLERGQVAGGTSGSCMGHLMVVPEPPEMYRLTRASVAAWGELEAEVGGFEYAPTGALWLAEDAEDVALLQRLAATFAGYGDPGVLLDPSDLRAREPGLAADLPGALHYPHDGIVMPTKAAGAVLRAAVAAGAEVRPATEVVGVRRGRAGAVEAVRTAGGAIATGALVLAAGVWSPALCALAGLGGLPVLPRRGDLAITAPRTSPVRHQLLEVGYLRTTGSGVVEPGGNGADPGAHALNVQPQSHGTCLIGSTRQLAGYGRRVDRRLLARSLRRARRFVPGLAAAPVVRTWAGLRPYTKDKRPIIGPLSAAPGLVLATGHEGLGITLAPITARLVADIVTGAEPALPLAPWGPDRFAAEMGLG